MKWDKGKGTECYFNGKQKGTIVEYLRKSRVLANGHDPGRFCWTCCKKIIFFFLEMKLSQALCYVCFYGEKKKTLRLPDQGGLKGGKEKLRLNGIILLVQLGQKVFRLLQSLPGDPGSKAF